ncbi:hypothetical protein [Peribacillus frigoritolerans]|uniref:Uncharacterized protein n=1 Tax=Peribacillus castrilensis TaxID=2897690 RepID=A0AAW9NK43_9BACI|nr:hypothetical protein [Peribacillus castrilensis]
MIRLMLIMTEYSVIGGGKQLTDVCLTYLIEMHIKMTMPLYQRS